MQHVRLLIHTLAFISSLMLTSMTHSANHFVYIGTQGTPEMGIALATFDSSSGTLSSPKLIERTPDPAFLALNRSGEFLYLCNTGTPGGVSAFAVDRVSGALRLAARFTGELRYVSSARSWRSGKSSLPGSGFSRRGSGPASVPDHFAVQARGARGGR